MSGAVDLGIADHGERASREQAAQIAIALLADTAKFILAPLEFCIGTSPTQAEKSRPVVQRAPAGFYSVDFGDIEPTACLQRAPESAEETAAREERLVRYAKDASPERELVVRETSTAPKEAKPSKIAAVLEKAKTVGITMVEVKAMTGWSKTGGFFGAVKRHGLTLTKDANGAYHAA